MDGVPKKTPPWTSQGESQKCQGHAPGVRVRNPLTLFSAVRLFGELLSKPPPPRAYFLPGAGAAGARAAGAVSVPPAYRLWGVLEARSARSSRSAQVRDERGLRLLHDIASDLVLDLVEGRKGFLSLVQDLDNTPANGLFTGSETCPTSSLNAASANSGTMRSLVNQPKSPPSEPASFETSLAIVANSSPPMIRFSAALASSSVATRICRAWISTRAFAPWPPHHRSL